jgi:hypothetical protein
MTRYGTLIAGAIALAAAAWDFLEGPGDARGNYFAIVSMTLGLVLIGAWLAIEIHYLWQEGKGDHGDSDAPDE